MDSRCESSTFRVLQQRLEGLPQGHFIHGAFVSGASGNRIESFDPGLSRPFAAFASGNAIDVENAVASAAQGFAVRARTLPVERARVLNKAAQIIGERAEYLAFVEALDCGKTLSEACSDVGSCIRCLEYCADAADKLEGRSSPLGPGLTSWTEREPAGITAHVIPRNYPTSTFARWVAPAPAAGCAAIVKPAETTPLAALILTGWLFEAALPARVLNVVTGLGHEAGAPLMSHPLVLHVTFAGSVQTGIGVMQAAAENVASPTQVLGGKSPLIALADCDVDRVVDGALWAIFSNVGQICSAGSRLVVERAIHDEMIEKLVAKGRGLRLGHGLSPQSEVGAINSKLRLDRIWAPVEGARQRWCQVLAGGQRVVDPEAGSGWFFEPTIIGGASLNDPAVQEEILGPVLTVQIIDDEDEAISLANCTDFGLASGNYTSDIGKALRIARGIQTGQVTINDYWAGGIEVRFDGWKKSGFGREKGLKGIEAYARTKAITIRH